MKPVLVACGVLREARIAEAQGGVIAVAGGGKFASTEARLEAIVDNAAAVASFGLCGALVEELRVGDVVIGSRVTTVGDAATCDASWREAIFCKLRSINGLRWHEVGVEGHRQLVGNSRTKRLVQENSGASVIDMESSIAARIACRHGLPLAVIRVVSDGVDDALPLAFHSAMRPDGGTDFAAMLRSLAAHPGQIPAFARASGNAMRALRRLGLLGRLLGPRLGLPDLG